MSSLKMTFSLTSLIFLIALGLVFVPTSVMAHVLDPADTTHNPETAAGTDHALVKSVEVDTMYLGTTNVVTATVTFEPASGTRVEYAAGPPVVTGVHAIIDPAAFAAANVSIQVKGDDGNFADPTTAPAASVIVDTVASSGVGAVYKVVIGPGVAGDTGTTEGEYRIRVLDAADGSLLRPADAADGSNATDAMFTVDTTTPTIESGPVVESGAVTGRTTDFNILVEFDSPIPADNVAVTLMPTGKAAAGTPVGSRGTQAGYTHYSIPITLATDLAAAFKGDVEISVTGTDMAGNKSTASTVTVGLDVAKGTPTVPVAGPEAIKKKTLTVPAKSYVIVGRTATPVGLPTSALARNLDAAGKAPTIQAWATMPDLEDLLVRGGTLLLTTVKADKLDRDGKADTAIEEAKERDVLITEVMAAVNEAQVGTDAYATHQWIELYNNLPVDVSVTLNANYGTPALDAAATEVRLDRLSNVAISGTSNGWAFTGLGANGVVDTVEQDTVDQTPNEPFVSFYRKERGKAGHEKASWMTSDRTYYAGAVVGEDDEGNRTITQVGIHQGTPGGIERTANVAITETPIPSTPFIINEVSTKGDWIELKNVDTAAKSLENYHLSQVTAANTDTSLVNFGGKKFMVPAGGVILIASGPANSDIPLASMLAGGVNVATPEGDRDKKGSPALYWMPGFFDIKAGESLLILRKNNDAKHLKTAGEIVDITGGLSLTSGQSLVWPIIKTAAPNAKVIDGAKGFSDGKVYHRAKTGTTSFDEAAWNKSAFTGLGYKRKVTNEDQYAGSPGFVDNGAKENAADLSANADASDAAVTISEIMFDTGAERQNLPQWIELYNSSMTQSVNLNGWKLALENYAEEAGPVFNATIIFEGGKIIPPNQTVLLVSGSRAQIPDPQRYLPTRVINLYLTKNYREALELTNRNDQVLSKTGFHLELFDKGGASVDEVGNIDGNRRTRDTETTWDLPKNGTDRRSSIIRIYAGVNFDGTGMRGTLQKNEAFDGLVAEGWSLASETDFGKVNAPAYYGDSDDYGTPGFRAGGALPVSLSKFRPERMKDTGEIVVRWITESELNNAGFNILRSEKRDGEFTKVHFEAGEGTTSERTVYEWKDTTAKPNVVYYYQIQDVSLDGEVTTLRTTHLRGNVTVAGKATTTWGEIKALQ